MDSSRLLEQELEECDVDQGLAHISVKNQIVNILGFSGHMIPVSATQLRHCRQKAATDHM